MLQIVSRPGEKNTLGEQNDAPGADESVTDAALAHLDGKDLLVELLDRVRQLLKADSATVLLLDPSSQQLAVTADRGIHTGVRQGIRIPVGKGFAGRVAAEKRPVIIERIDYTNVLYPIIQEHDICSLLGVPLLSTEMVIGALHVRTLVPRRFTEEDVRLLQIVADRVGFAIQSRRAEVERAAAAVLQRSQLAAGLPVVPGLELAARYVSVENRGVSGDWYDVFALPSGWLRSALRAYALLGGDPAEVLDRIDQHVQHFDPETMATVCLAMFEPSLERLQVSPASHPPPTLALPNEPAALLDVPIDHPVGVPGGPRRRATTITIPPGGLLCFYTDGLVKRRGSSLDGGLARLCELVVAGPVDSVCAEVMAQFLGDDPADDDVAMLVVRHQNSGEIGPLDLVVPTLPWSLRDIRLAMRRWLSAVGAAPRSNADLLIAVGEACANAVEANAVEANAVEANAVEHAYGPPGGTVPVHLELRLPDVLATVGDTGRWCPPRGGPRTGNAVHA